MITQFVGCTKPFRCAQPFRCDGPRSRPQGAGVSSTPRLLLQPAGCALAGRGTTAGVFGPQGTGSFKGSPLGRYDTYQPALPPRALDRGLLQTGELARMRLFVDKLLRGGCSVVPCMRQGSAGPVPCMSVRESMPRLPALPPCLRSSRAVKVPSLLVCAGEPVTVVALGGSVTWGAIQGNGFASQFFRWINATFPPAPGGPPHTLLNRGMGGEPAWRRPRD